MRKWQPVRKMLRATEKTCQNINFFSGQQSGLGIFHVFFPLVDVHVHGVDIDYPFSFGTCCIEMTRIILDGNERAAVETFASMEAG